MPVICERTVLHENECDDNVQLQTRRMENDLDIHRTKQLLQISAGPILATDGKINEVQMKERERTFADLLTQRQELLQKAAEGQAVDADDGDLHHLVDKLVEQLQREVTQAKTLVDGANGDIETCNSIVLQARSDFLRSKENAVDEKTSFHKTCRSSEATKKADKIAKCSARDDGLRAAKDFPDCIPNLKTMDAASVRECIVKAKEWSCPLPVLDDQEDECTQVAAELTTLTELCNEKQIVLERDSCAYTEELHVVCMEEEACVGNAIERRAKMVDAVNHLLSHSKKMYVTLEKIKCVVQKTHQLQNEEVNVTTVNVHECIEKNYAIPELFTQELDEVTERLQCDEGSAVSRRPGTAGWRTHEYGSLDQSLLLQTEACEALPARNPLGLWTHALNINPRDGHQMAYGSRFWSGTESVGEAGSAFTRDFKSTVAFEMPAKYIAIVRHNDGKCEAAKVWRLTENGRSLQSYFATYPGRITASSGKEQFTYKENDGVGMEDDPIMSVSGDVIFNMAYGNNGVRITLDTARIGESGLPPIGLNDDSMPGLGGEYTGMSGSSSSHPPVSSSWWWDVCLRDDDLGTMSKYAFAGTDQGTSADDYAERKTNYPSQWAVFVAEDLTNPAFPCQGTDLANPTGLDAEPASDVADEFEHIYRYSGGSNAMSVYRPRKNGFCSLGDIMLKDHSSTAPEGTTASFISSSVGKQPTDFQWVGAENQAGGINFFAPVCEDGFVAVGHVAVHAPESSPNNKPPLDAVCCVPKDTVCPYENHAGVVERLWSDGGTGGMDNCEWKRKGLDTFVADITNCAGRFSPPCTQYYAACDE